MRKVRDWSLPAKILVGSVTGLVLSLGLCGVGTGLEGRVTSLQIVGTLGIWLFLISAIGIFLGILAVIFSAVRGNK